MMKQIDELQRLNFIDNYEQAQVMSDSLILENRAGERMGCEVNWGEYMAG